MGNAHLADELDVLPLNVLYYHDLHFVEEVQSEVAKCISVRGQFGDWRKNVYSRIQLNTDIIIFSIVLYLRMDFWMSRTLQPAFFICFTRLRM